MVKYLLDSNVLSELHKKPEKMDASVYVWSQRTDMSDCFLSAITIFETEVGVLQRERKDSKQGAMLRLWLEDYVLEVFKWRILPVDSRVARLAAKYRVPNPSPNMDAFIAATAAINNCTIVTRNVKDFAGLDVKVFNPWEEQSA